MSKYTPCDTEPFECPFNARYSEDCRYYCGLGVDEYEPEDCESMEDVSLVTNFQKGDRHIYEKAIELSGHSELYIADDATDIFGNRLEHLLALRSKEPKELGDFWDIYEHLKEEFK